MEKDILLAASFYARAYYLNPSFDGLPRDVKLILKAAATTAAEKARGVIVVGFRDNDLYIEASREHNDLDYDEIAARLAADQFADEHAETLTQVNTWRRVKGL